MEMKRIWRVQKVLTLNLNCWKLQWEVVVAE